MTNSFAKHFLKELNGVPQPRVDDFIAYVDKLMEPYQYCGAPSDGFESIKSKINAALRKAKHE